MTVRALQNKKWAIVSLITVALLTTAGIAQFRGGGGGRRFRSAPDRSEYPQWDQAAGFKQDVFTFARVQYDSFGYRNSGRHWANDFPDCDWNFSYRLQQLTSLQVNPNGAVVRLTDRKLYDYPFIYMSNVGRMELSDAEVKSLRRYLLNGGFLMADDFWTRGQWEHVYREMKRVFPDREPRELPKDHEIFHNVFDLKVRLQVPSIFAWRRGDMFEYWHGDPEGDPDPHFWGFFDDKGRLAALLCHNNDIGDGWEREGEDKAYFRQFSEKISYPLGINIVTYVMTH